MRIGLIAPPWIPVPPTGYGGTEFVVDTLARGLRKAGHDVLLAATSDSTCPVPLLPGLDAADSTWLGYTRSEFHQIIRAYDGLGGVDIIHDHTLAGPLYALKPPGIPVVTTIHSLLTPDIEAIYRAATRVAAVVAISHDQVSRTPDLSVARVIHHGMDVDGIPVGAGKGGFALFLGRMNPDKGIVEAIRMARTAGVPLKIATKMREKEEREYFAHAVEPLLGSDTELIQEVGAAEKYRLLGESLALLNPIQWHEPFGLVMIEALASGTPVVGTPRGAAPEIVDVGVTGYLSEDPAELAQLLLRAGELDRSACRRSVEERFSGARMVQDYVDLYEELLRRRAAS